MSITRRFLLKLTPLLFWRGSTSSLSAAEARVALPYGEAYPQLDSLAVGEWWKAGQPSTKKAPNPLRPRAFGGKGAEGMKKEIPSNPRKNHVERKNPESHLPFQAQLAYEEKLPDLFRYRFYRRDSRAYPTEKPAHRSLLRSLLKQKPGLGGKIGKSPPAVKGIIRAPARGPF